MGGFVLNSFPNTPFYNPSDMTETKDHAKQVHQAYSFQAKFTHSLAESVVETYSRSTYLTL